MYQTYKAARYKDGWAVLNRHGMLVASGMGPAAAMLMAAKLNWENIQSSVRSADQ